ncbi:MAG TPA: hypothetical protein VED17_09975 [Nitrososphaerales archaeon]|nr:hypothetical protein [Nitrososphaerales archaeon]
MAILLVIILVIAIAGYFVLAQYPTLYPPFCHGSPPGGDCLANYSYDFTLSINYTGAWTATYYGSRSVSTSFISDGNYLQKNLNGAGNYTTSVALSGQNTQDLTLCASVTKLDSSTSTARAEDLI